MSKYESYCESCKSMCDWVNRERVNLSLLTQKNIDLEFQIMQLNALLAQMKKDAEATA